MRSLLTNQSPSRAAGTHFPWLFASINYPFNQPHFRHQVSSIGAAGMSPHAVTPWPWRRDAGCERQGAWGHARHPVRAPSMPAVVESFESWWRENPDQLQKEHLGPGGHLVQLSSQSWAIWWRTSPGSKVGALSNQKDDLNLLSNPSLNSSLASTAMVSPSI